MAMSKNDNGSTPIVHARLDQETYEALKRMAEGQRRKLGPLIRIILEDYVSTVESVGR